MFDNSMQGRLYGSDTDEIIGGWRELRNFKMCVFTMNF
jgi:hypothetical protein